MKNVLPWVLVGALAIGVYALYAAQQKQRQELAAALAKAKEVEVLEKRNQELSKLQSEVAELDRLRAENKEVHKLRGETQQLRQENQQLKAQTQSASAAVRGRPDLVREITQLRRENQQLRAQLGGQNALPDTGQPQEAVAPAAADGAALCVENLQLLNAAKERWAQDNNLGTGTLAQMANVEPYIKDFESVVCPEGGRYTLNGVGRSAVCNVAGHAVAR